MINSINAYAPQKNCCQPKEAKFKPQNVSFAGTKVDEFFSKIASKEKTKNIICKIADNKYMKKLVDWAAEKKIKTNKKGEQITEYNSDKIAQYLMVGYSALLQTNHIYNILRNDQMPQERKETLAVNNALAFVLPTLGAFTIDKSLNRGIDRFQNYAEKVRGSKFNSKQAGGLKTLKSVFIFSMMYKYFATIVTTPLADVTTDFMRDKGIIGKKRAEKVS